MKPTKSTVLFLCSGNSARSQMAEALLRHYAGDRFDVFSAGLEPRGVNPLTVAVMDEIGIDIRQQRSKSVSEFLGRARVGCAIFVCPRAEQSCPHMYPFVTKTLSWPFDDPAAVAGTPEEILRKFREVRDQIDRKIRAWLAAAGEESRTAQGTRQ
jgi:arsenate reductase